MLLGSSSARHPSATRGRWSTATSPAPPAARRPRHERDRAESIGRAIAAIHSLPTSLVTDAGLPVRDGRPMRPRTARISSKTAPRPPVAVPTDLLTRWSLALEDSALWQFQPTVVHGALAPNRFSSRVTGHGHPGLVATCRSATRRRTCSGSARPRSEESATASSRAYNPGRHGPVDHQLRKRARLYAELEIAKWLLHGVRQRDEAIIADAETMLAGLRCDACGADLLNPLSTDTGQIMARRRQSAGRLAASRARRRASARPGRASARRRGRQSRPAGRPARTTSRGEEN